MLQLWKLDLISGLLRCSNVKNFSSAVTPNLKALAIPPIAIAQYRLFGDRMLFFIHTLKILVLLNGSPQKS